MNTEQILMCVVALILGMLLANMLKSVCGCKVVEGQSCCHGEGTNRWCSWDDTQKSYGVNANYLATLEPTHATQVSFAANCTED